MKYLMCFICPPIACCMAGRVDKAVYQMIVGLFVGLLMGPVDFILPFLIPFISIIIFPVFIIWAWKVCAMSDNAAQVGVTIVKTKTATEGSRHNDLLNVSKVGLITVGVLVVCLLGIALVSNHSSSLVPAQTDITATIAPTDSWGLFLQKQHLTPHDYALLTAAQQAKYQDLWRQESATATVESSPTSEPSIVNSTPSPTPLAQSTRTPETVVMRAEPVATPTAEPYAFIGKIQTAFDNHDWRTITDSTADGEVNYFGHRHASNAYIIRDMQNDAVIYSSAKSTCYPETFTHDLSDPSIIYDSINVYSEVQERHGRLHKALVRLTVGYRIENGVPIVYAIVEKALSKTKPST
jgi:hypothetical protein